MKTINLRGISNPMSDKEMKNTIGGGNVVKEAVLGIDSGGSGGGGSYPGGWGCNGFGYLCNNPCTLYNGKAGYCFLDSVGTCSCWMV